jgi:hypothetical protein
MGIHLCHRRGTVGNIILAAVTYTFDHCLKACGAYNFYKETSECAAVNFQAYLDLGKKNGNCYLLNNTGMPEFYADTANKRISAVLVNP